MGVEFFAEVKEVLRARVEVSARKSREGEGREKKGEGERKEGGTDLLEPPREYFDVEGRAVECRSAKEEEQVDR